MMMHPHDTLALGVMVIVTTIIEYENGDADCRRLHPSEYGSLTSND